MAEGRSAARGQEGEMVGRILAAEEVGACWSRSGLGAACILSGTENRHRGSGGRASGGGQGTRTRAGGDGGGASGTQRDGADGTRECADSGGSKNGKYRGDPKASGRFGQGKPVVSGDGSTDWRPGDGEDARRAGTGAAGYREQPGGGNSSAI